MQFTDRLTLEDAAGIRITNDGYAVASARVARGGNIQIYLGSEVGITDKTQVRVYRPADEVFKRDAIASYAGVPIVINHPQGKVTADNWKKLSVGETGEEVLRDGEFVRVPMMLRDANAITQVKAGKVELSMGYDAELIVADGTTPTGEKFDAIMTSFKMNHLAIVDSARGGKELRIGDAVVTISDKWGASPVNPADERTDQMADVLRKLLVDGLSVETTDQGAQAIEKLQGQLRDSAANIEALKATHTTALADKDKVITTKDEEIGGLKAEVKKLTDVALKPADIDKLVVDRTALVAVVTAIDAKIEIAGKSDMELRKAAVKARLGDDAIKDASDAEVTGMFKAIAKDVKVDPVRDAVARGVVDTVSDKTVNDAYAAMVKDITSAHRPAAAN